MLSLHQTLNSVIFRYTGLRRRSISINLNTNTSTSIKNATTKTEQKWRRGRRRKTEARNVSITKSTRSTRDAATLRTLSMLVKPREPVLRMCLIWKTLRRWKN